MIFQSCWLPECAAFQPVGSQDDDAPLGKSKCSSSSFVGAPATFAPTCTAKASSHEPASLVMCIVNGICVPQVAAAGHAHYRVRKAATDGMTQSSVAMLDADGRTDEIARMLGGAEVTDEARAAAKRLLEASSASS